MNKKDKKIIKVLIKSNYIIYLTLFALMIITSIVLLRSSMERYALIDFLITEVIIITFIVGVLFSWNIKRKYDEVDKT